MNGLLQNPRGFRQQLMGVDPRDRERWVDAILGIGDLPDDADDLPHGCVPYLPSSVDVLLRVVDAAQVTAGDVFVDVGSGLGRAITLVHLLTGAGAVGLEIQAGLAHQAQAMSERLHLDRVRTIHGNAERLVSHMSHGTVFFFYCPFSGDRLARVLEALRSLAIVRPLRLCFVDMPAPELPWLTAGPVSREDDAVVICTSRLHTELGARAANANAATYAATYAATCAALAMQASE